MFGYEHVGMGWGGAWMVLIWTVPIVLAAPLIPYFTGNRGAKAGKTALEILEARYARGEIDHEEYRKRRADLGA
jgi:putative membrane protein